MADKKPLDQLSLVELTQAYNDLGPAKPIKKFKSKKQALERIEAFVASDETLPAPLPGNAPEDSVIATPELAEALTMADGEAEAEAASDEACGIEVVGVATFDADGKLEEVEVPRGLPILLTEDGRSVPGEGYVPFLHKRPNVIHETATVLLLQEPPLSYQQILVEIRHWFPGCKTTVKCLRWYASRLREERKVLYRPKSPVEVK